jgi:WD40 repeat protein
VKAWATSIATSDFATGDDTGHLAIWPAKGGKPALTSVLSTPINGLSFNPTGTRLAITDSTGWLVIWDVATAKAIHRIKRPAGVKAMAYGPNDDVILLAAGKTVEVWWLPELLK